MDYFYLIHCTTLFLSDGIRQGNSSLKSKIEITHLLISAEYSYAHYKATNNDPFYSN